MELLKQVVQPWPEVRVMLMENVDGYRHCAEQRAMRSRFPSTLRNFARFATQREETLICTPTAIEWASQAPSLNQREHRLQIVLRFARHLQAEDPRHEVPPIGVFRHRRTRRAHMDAAGGNGPAAGSRSSRTTSSLRPHMYSTLFALLYVTGSRISEALALESMISTQLSSERQNSKRAGASRFIKRQ